MKSLSLDHEKSIEVLSFLFWIIAIDKCSGPDGKKFLQRTKFINFLRPLNRLIKQVNQMALSKHPPETPRIVGEKLATLLKSRQAGESSNLEIEALAKEYNPTISRQSLDEVCAPLNINECKGPIDSANARIKYIFPNQSSSRTTMANYRKDLQAIKRLKEIRPELADLNSSKIVGFFAMSEIGSFKDEEIRIIFQFMTENNLFQDHK